MRFYLKAAFLKHFFTLTQKHITCTFILSFSSISFYLLFFCSSVSSCLPRACIVFFVPLVRSSSFLLLLHHWFLYFFRFSYLFVFCHCLKVTTISLSRCCRSRATLHHHRRLHAQGWWCFKFFYFF